MLVQKAVLLGLFSEKLIFGGVYYWNEFAFQNGLGLTVKRPNTPQKKKTSQNILKQLALVGHGLFYV